MQTSPIALMALSALILSAGCKPKVQQSEVASAANADTPEDREACVALFKSGEFKSDNMQFEFSVAPEFKQKPNSSDQQAMRNYGAAILVDVIAKRFDGGWQIVTPEPIRMTAGTFQKEFVRFAHVENRELRLVTRPSKTPYEIVVDYGTETVAATCPKWDDPASTATSAQPGK